MLVGVTKLQAILLLDRLKKSSNKGLLMHIPAKTINEEDAFVGSSNTFTSSMEAASMKFELYPT